MTEKEAQLLAQAEAWVKEKLAAEHRHQVLVSYLDEFYAEWDGLR